MVSNEDRAAAVICYFGLLGFIIALVIHNQKKTRIGAFHMRQSLGMMISGFAFAFLYIILAFIPIIGWLAIVVIALGMFVLFIMGIVNAAQGKFVPIPILGEMFVRMFGNTFE